MATAAKKTPTPPRKTIVTRVDDTPGDVVESADAAPKITLNKVVDPTSPKVTVVVPKRFTLTRDDGQPVEFHAGVQEMHRSDAEHWFSVAQGVTIYQPKV